jgi:hypothetical protein
MWGYQKALKQAQDHDKGVKIRGLSSYLGGQYMFVA